jgi:histidinol-phosphate aminotransferase
MSLVSSLARPEILALKAYSHAAWEPSLQRMHANELPWRVAGDASAAGLNRYPEPQPPQLVQGMARLYDVDPAYVLVGRGSDEAIDLLLRVFCRAGQDSILVCPPTYSMYAVAAGIQGAGVVNVPLLADQGFALDVEGLLRRVDATIKLVFVCSPNNPTGNAVPRATLLELARGLAGRALLVVDEAYAEFMDQASVAPEIPTYSNLVVMRTLSKSHGLAGARCGALIATPELIALARKVIPPYAITEMTVEAVAPLLAPAGIAAMQARVQRLLAERERLRAALAKATGVQRIWPSDANFLLVQFAEPDEVLRRVRAAGLIIRDMRQPALPRALRISIGTPEQNDILLRSLA